VSLSLTRGFREIEEVASEARLSEHCVKKIRKATGIATDIIATIAFFFSILSAKTDALSCAPDMERAVSNTQIPAIYLQLVSKKTKSKDRRKVPREKSQELLPPFLARDGPFYGHEEEILLIEYVAEECA